MELLAWFWDLVVHLDVHLAEFVREHGVWVYALLFGIVFCETGLVVTPFLPGDSLLFVAGAVAAAGDMNIAAVIGTLIAAALCGDNVNYFVGRWIGPRVFHFEKSRWFNPAHLARAHAFYEKHGGKTIVLARFVPIIRTFAPVVAGAGAMDYRRFLFFNVFGGIGWIVSMSLLGYFLGQIPWVEKNLEKAVLGIILLSLTPIFIHWWKARREAAQARGAGGPE
jgi:membrane-associated protein